MRYQPIDACSSQRQPDNFDEILHVKAYLGRCSSEDFQRLSYEYFVKLFFIAGLSSITLLFRRKEPLSMNGFIHSENSSQIMTSHLAGFDISTSRLARASEFLKKGLSGKYILVFTCPNRQADFLSTTHFFM